MRFVLDKEKGKGKERKRKPPNYFLLHVPFLLFHSSIERKGKAI